VDRRKDLPDELTEADAFTLAWRESCEVCRLFGNSFLASRLRIADLPLRISGPAGATYVRHGVGLDRDLRTAARGILYTFEAVNGGVVFELRMEIENPADHEVGLILIGLELFGVGFATVGGKGARGLGAVRIDVAEIRRRTAEDYFTGPTGHVLTPDEQAPLRGAARQYYLGEG
jgi:CRISPR/Cas system CSM-associated protein Csm3 (group 7 of RAMP superfamily)